MNIYDSSGNKINPPSRICPECGSKHNLVVEEIATGKVLQIIDKCRGCFLGFGPNGINKGKDLIKTKLPEEPKCPDTK